MNSSDLFPVDPAQWSRLHEEIMPKVVEVREQMQPCTVVHPVLAMLGIEEVTGSTADVSISGIDFSGALAFPVRSASDGSLLNVLFVSDAGDGSIEESIIPGAAINGGMVSIGKMNGDTLYLTVGLPGALAIATATGAPVVSAIYTENLPEVTAALNARYPSMGIIVCAGTSDGPSLPVATRAAASIGARLAVAETGSTFFGCYRESGIEGVARSLEAAEVQPGFGLAVEMSDPLDPPAPTRWPGRVNTILMIQHAVMLIRRYLIVDVYAAITIVLWALATYFAGEIRVAPLLSFLSPTRRCGKTTALGLLKSLVCRPYSASNVTPATLYRLPALKPTVLIDEIDTFLRSRELVGILNGGHTRDAASIARVEKGKTVSFDTFFMKALFGIGLLPETLADRSIVVPLERKAENEEVEKHIVCENDVFAPVRACFASLAHRYADAVRHASRNPIKLGNDRAGDNWEPLLAVASLFGDDWVDYARRAAKLLSAHTGNQSDAGLEELIVDIKVAFDSCGAAKLTTEHLIEFLCDDPEKPWATFSRGRPITPHDLAKMLKPLRIESVNLREDRVPGQRDASPTRKGYHRAAFARAFRQYVPREPEDSETA
ncbi:DUF3631 domain-containing protein [Paraburkholderia sp. 31.1]|uniref:DUF3631 domain-containing protein n=1 Tax=Paraburkholderia sp. 31.1 TaxID=2615205 RepID=UPI00165608EF|nr:DUF3631 domain-containing protein [Paraburkholderia sp. 31.1]MBC8726598.1 DUF3631 domain-containing protein [Paraburkholderia sp. 31.1]